MVETTGEKVEAESESTGEPPPTIAGPAPDLRTVGTMGLFILGILYTLYFARAFLLPITIAILLNFLLSPAVRWLRRRRIPNPVGAAIVVLGLLGGMAEGAHKMAAPAQEWLAKGPASLDQVRVKLKRFRQPMEQVTRTAEQMEHAASGPDGAQPREVVVRGPTFGARLFGATQTLVTAALGVVILLYFLLAAGELFTLKIVRVIPLFGDKRKAVSILKETESSISKYLVTIAMVNVGQGLVVWMVMYLIGMPNAALWGVLAGAAEFVPYVGPLTVVVILGLAGLVTFEPLGHALLPAGAFLVINLLQSNLVSPFLLGHRLALNPVAIFIGLAFWLWIWGIPGAFIAVPVLATLKICCDHIEMLAPVGEFLGE